MRTSTIPVQTRAQTSAARAVDAHKTYGSGTTEVRALDGVSVEFATGTSSAIMGPSGSGTSTLLQCVAELDTLTSGSAFVGADDLSALDDHDLTVLRRDHVGFVFQSFNLIPTLTAEADSTLPLRLAGRKVDPAWFRQVVDTLGIAGRLHHRPADLSGGQQQRVAVARALASRPAIVERTREIGLLRAVGMTRSQLRSAIRWESVIIAVQGTLLGLVIGVFLGWALIRALADEGIEVFSLPVGSLAVVVLLGGLAGMAAAVLPSRRAARLDVLRAVASE